MWDQKTQPTSSDFFIIFFVQVLFTKQFSFS